MSTNYQRAFESRPAVYEAWQQLNGAIKAQMDLRRYELVALAAARILPALTSSGAARLTPRLPAVLARRGTADAICGRAL